MDVTSAVLRAPAAIHAGRGAIAAIPALAVQVGERPIVCTDPVMAGLPGVEAIVDALAVAGRRPPVFAEARAEVPLDNVDACHEFARGHGADSIVAVGGGSTIDLAKLAALRLVHDGDLEAFFGEGQVPGAGAPVIAVPTTAGTGSEVTSVAVVTASDREMKVGISSPFLIPTYAVCDPELTLSCPPTVTAHSGIDALAHAIEAYTAAVRPTDWQVATTRVFIGKNPVSDSLALSAVRLIAANLERAVHDGGDLAAREAMLLGATLAGLAFGQAGTSLAHALQYPVGAATHTPHGLGVGVLLPYAMRFNRTVRARELAELAAALGVDTGGMDADAASTAAIETVAGLRKRIGLPAGLDGLGIAVGQVDRLAELALQVTRLLDNNPRPVDAATLAAVLEAARRGDMEGIP
jgi:alcohol dehydrogenase